MAINMSGKLYVTCVNKYEVHVNFLDINDQI